MLEIIEVGVGDLISLSLETMFVCLNWWNKQRFTCWIWWNKTRVIESWNYLLEIRYISEMKKVHPPVGNDGPQADYLVSSSCFSALSYREKHLSTWTVSSSQIQVGGVIENIADIRVGGGGVPTRASQLSMYPKYCQAQRETPVSSSLWPTWYPPPHGFLLSTPTSLLLNAVCNVL